MRSFFNKNKRLVAYSLLSLCVVAFVLLLILPADYFDNGRATCVSVIIFNKKCYGCGMTRAIQHLIHFDFKEAYHFNWLSFIVLPLSIFMILWEIKKMLKRK